MIILFSIGIALSFILLFYNGGYKTANVYLGLFLFFLTFLTFSHYLYIFSNSVSELVILLSVPINSTFYIIGPFAYLYVRSILTHKIDFKKSDLIHFIIFGIIFFGRLPFNFSSWELKEEMAIKFINNSWLELSNLKHNLLLNVKTNYLLKGIHVLFYIIAIWIMIYKAKIRNTSELKGNSQILTIKRWSIFFTTVFTFSAICLHIIIYFFMSIPERAKFQQQGEILFSLIFLLSMTLILGLIFFPQILYGLPIGNDGWIKKNDEIIENNTQKEPGTITMLHEKHLQNIRMKLEDWVEKNRFLSEDITLNTLSSEIKLPLYHLIYYFNQVNDEKFIDWRNNLRVDYAIKRMKNELEIKKTLAAIGKECGFRSNSTFRQAFKRRTGMVPKDFI
jgi:AraC-like DNA-binding protein